MFGLNNNPFAIPISLSRIHEDLSLKRQKHMSHTSECTWHMFHAVWGRPVHGKYSISQFYLAKVAVSDSLSRIHEDLSLEGQKYMPHTSKCSWHMFRALRDWPVHGKYQSLNFIWQRWQWVIHSQESMKTSASKGRNICHTPVSVHGICFMPFEADLFMASVSLSLSILFAKVAMSDALPRIHEDLSLEGQKQVSHTSECTWHLFHAFWGWPVHGKYTVKYHHLAKVEVEVLHHPISSFANKY